MNHLTPDERADLQAAAACDWPILLRFVSDLAAAYHAAGLVEGDLGHDGTVRWEADA